MALSLPGGCGSWPSSAHRSRSGRNLQPSLSDSFWVTQNWTEQGAGGRRKALVSLYENKGSVDLSVGPEIAASLLSGSTVVIDCTDRFAARHLVTAVCHQLSIPLVIGSALQWFGQLLVVDPRDKTSGCYACLFPKGEVQPVVADAACSAQGSSQPPLDLSALPSQRCA